MQSYVARRALTFLITIWLAASLSFVTLLVLPGNPARLMLGVDANPQALAALERQLGLDAPAAVRYGRWLAGAVRFIGFIRRVPLARGSADRPAAAK